jgi:hypothetical protein
MRAGKKKRLMARGWAVGDARDFLDLSDEEAAFVELKLALADNLKQRRLKRRMTQTEWLPAWSRASPALRRWRRATAR